MAAEFQWIIASERGNVAMMSREQNDQLSRVGPDTLMGKLLRRYWAPFLLVSEIPEPDCPPVRVKLMGENLICFRDSKGRIGLMDEFCAHRGVSLWFGQNEECGLRCPYHGWKYDVTGQCVDLPSEPEESGFRKNIKLKSYPCIEKAGIVWAYMGPPGTQPPPPALEWTEVEPPQRFVSKRLQECNYLQAMEGGIDSSHVSWLHGSELNKDPLFKGSKGNVYNEQDRMPLFEVEEFPGGLLIGARRNADGDKYYWRITPWIIPWYSIIPPRAGHPLGAHAWVPIDDENCWAWSINYHPKRALTKAEVSAMQDGEGIHVKYVPGTFIPLANKSNNYLLDRESQRHGHSSTGVDGIAMQDASIQESMGPIQDRTKEHLCATDKGIVMTRRILLRAAKAAAEGGAVPATEPEAQRVRSASIELEKMSRSRKARGTDSMRRWERTRSRSRRCGWLFRGGLDRLADRGIDARHDFLSHQLHRTFGQRRVSPVEARIDELAEIAGFLVQLEDFIDDFVDRTEGYAIVDHVIVRDLVVWLFLVAFEHVKPVAALHLRAHLFEIKAIRAFRVIVAVALRYLVIVGDEDRTRHAPVGDIGFGAGFGLALGIVGPVRLEVL
jgi:phenylpropionate dioxygenase-like ring-hydroxylating dioxygenase large terminal subunit